MSEATVLTNGIDTESDGNTSFLRAARNGQLEKVLEHLKTNIDINTSNANGLNALHLASKDGHVEIVEELLKRGAVVDAATKKGNTALHIASLAGQEEVVKLLVQHGASVNVQSQNGFTPLYMAAQENHDNVVKFLLANGANQSLSTEDGFTPLAVAMQQGHEKVVTVLLENDTRGKVRLPALHIAAKKDDVRAAKLLLENDHNPDVTSKSGFTPLHIASHYGNQPIANLLIQEGADVNYSAKHNITPLHVAAKWGKSNMVALLLEQGAHIEAKTRDGLTPLHCAARSGHEQVVDMLLERSAPISSKTKNGLAPLHMAAQGDHVDAARILLYHRAPVDEVTVDYLTALHVAAHCGHVRVAKLLLDRQADANARALNGFTPLHIACKKNRIKVVELLLKHGACIGATTESGLTPLHVASFMGCMNIVIYLLQHDASPDIPTVRGETPLHLAARANQTDIIRILLRNGAQVDARAREQQTPLHIASRLGNVDIVMLLLQHGAKVDNITKDMYTALHIAAKEGQDEVAAVLIENGASLNATTKKGFTPLHLAAKYGHLKVAKLLVQKESPVDAQGKNGVTPLHVASHYDHQNVALLLLDKGASPHANAKNGHTPLHIAAKKNQMDIAHTLLEYGAQPDAESKAGFTPLHLGAQEGHTDITALLLENKASPNYQSKNGLTPMHLCAQENKVAVAEILYKNGVDVNSSTKGGYTPLHIASHYGQSDMVKFLLSKGADVKTTTSLGYTPLHQAAQQGHTHIVNLLLENSAEPNSITINGQTPLHIAQKLGYITVIDRLKEVTEPVTTPANSEEKYRVVAPEAMHENFLSDSEEEGEDTLLGEQTYRYLTADEMKSLGDDSLPIDVTRDERIDSNRMVGNEDLNSYPPRHIEDSISPEHVHPNYVEYFKKTPDNIDVSRHPVNIGFLVSFLVDARGGAMRGCRHSGVRIIVPPQCAPSPTRITCRYVRPQRTPHPPPLMEGEALASRVIEFGPVGAKFLGPVIIEVPHFAALREKEREIVILRSDNGESWKEHTIDATEDVLNEVLKQSFDPEDLNQLEDGSSGRLTRIITQDFPQYFAVISRIRQEVHAIGPEGGMVSSTVVPQVQAVFPQGALTKKIKVGLQAQPIDPELTAKLLGHGVAVSPVVTVEPRRRKFHKAITLSMPAPTAHSQGMINQYSGSAPTLRLLCSITGGTSRAQWEDVTGSTPLTFVNDCVSFTTTVSARFWLMDCRNISDATKMATELYREAIHVPFIAKFVVFAKRIDPLEARLRVFCMTDDKEDKTLEYQEQFTEIAKSRDVEVLEGKSQYIEFAGNLVPITKSGEQLQFSFRAFKENRLPFSVRIKDQHAEAISRCLFMREPKVQKGEQPQQPICILNIVIPDDIVSETVSLTDSDSIRKKYYSNENFDYYRQDPRLADMSNLLGEDWVHLANQLGLTTSEINVIKSEYPDSVAKQAQSMLRMWLSQSGNREQTNTLDNALRRIGREDIVNQCLNLDNRSQEILRLRTEEIGKQRLKLESAQKKQTYKQSYQDQFDKYSAEEKTLEPSDEEEDFNKTVPERREQIVKRLSVERAIPASSQRVEIAQEISSIKRQSLVEDKIAEVQQKGNIEPMKLTTIKPVSKIIQEKREREQFENLNAQNDDDDDLIKRTKDSQEDRRDSVLLEEVTQRLETKKTIIPKLIADEDPKSPKLSKTPPPSPADFILKEKQATTTLEWDATKRDSPKEDAVIKEDSKGKTTSSQYLAKLEGKPIESSIVEISNASSFDLNEIKNETNAFIQSEISAEPYDKTTENLFKTNEPHPKDVKSSKKGFLGSLKALVGSGAKSDSESEQSSPKKEKKTKKHRAVPEPSPATPRKAKLPTPPPVSEGKLPEENVEKTQAQIFTVNIEEPITEIEKNLLEKAASSVEEKRRRSFSEPKGVVPTKPVEPTEPEVSDNTQKVKETPSKLFGLFKTSKDKEESDESEIIEKQDREISKESPVHSEKRKKSGILGFLSRKSKKSGEAEINNDLALAQNKEHFEKIETTNAFLSKEKENYEDAPREHSTNSHEEQVSEENKHESTLLESIMEKSETAKILLSKFKHSDDSKEKQSSYIKFDNDDSLYEPIEIPNEKQKKVTFEKEEEVIEDTEVPTVEQIYELKQENPEVGEKQEFTPSVPPNITELTGEFLQGEITNFHDVKIKTEDAAEETEEPEHAKEGKNKGIFSIFSKKTESPVKKKSKKDVQMEPTSEPSQITTEEIVVKEATESVATSEDSSKSRKDKSKGIFKIFNRKSQEKEIPAEREFVVPEIILDVSCFDQIKSSEDFLKLEKENYEDSKYEKPEIVLEQQNEPDFIPEEQVTRRKVKKSDSKMDKIFKIFNRKSQERDVDIETIQKEEIPAETRDIQDEEKLSNEKLETEVIALDKFHREELQSTHDFLQREKEVYHDAKEEPTVSKVETKQEVQENISQSKGFLKLFSRKSEERDKSPSDVERKKKTDHDIEIKKKFKIFEKKGEKPKESSNGAVETKEAEEPEPDRKANGNIEIQSSKVTERIEDEIKEEITSPSKKKKGLFDIGEGILKVFSKKPESSDTKPEFEVFEKEVLKPTENFLKNEQISYDDSPVDMTRKIIVIDTESVGTIKKTSEKIDEILEHSEDTVAENHAISSKETVMETDKNELPEGKAGIKDKIMKKTEKIIRKLKITGDDSSEKERIKYQDNDTDVLQKSSDINEDLTEDKELNQKSPVKETTPPKHIETKQSDVKTKSKDGIFKIFKKDTQQSETKDEFESRTEILIEETKKSVPVEVNIPTETQRTEKIEEKHVIDEDKMLKEKPKDGIFKIFKKDPKTHEKTNIQSKTEISIEKIETSNDILKIPDEIFEKKSEEKERTDERRETSKKEKPKLIPKTDGIFKIFKKDTKPIETDIESISVVNSPEVIQETNNFLQTEKDLYQDVKPIEKNDKIDAGQIDDDFKLEVLEEKVIVEKSDQAPDKVSKTKGKKVFKIFSRKSEERDKIIPTEEIQGVKTKSEDVTRTKIFGKRTGTKVPDAPEAIIQEIKDSVEPTQAFLDTEKKEYDQGKVKSEEKDPLEETVKENPEKTEVNVSPKKKPKTKGLFGILGIKSEEKEEELNVTAETDQKAFDSQKLPAEKGEREELKEKDKKSKGIFNILGKKDKKKSDSESKPENELPAIKKEEFTSTHEFLQKEKELYHDASQPEEAQRVLEQPQETQGVSLLEEISRDIEKTFTSGEQILTEAGETTKIIKEVTTEKISVVKKGMNEYVTSTKEVITEDVDGAEVKITEKINEAEGLITETVTEYAEEPKKETAETPDKSEEIQEVQSVPQKDGNGIVAQEETHEQSQESDKGKEQVTSPKKKGLFGFLKKKPAEDDKIHSEEKQTVQHEEKIIVDAKNKEEHSEKKKPKSKADDKESKGILGFFTRRSKSKEREEGTRTYDKEATENIDQSKSFLEKEIEMYHDVKSFCGTEKMIPPHTHQEEDVETVKTTKKSTGILKFFKKKSKEEHKKSEEITEAKHEVVVDVAKLEQVDDVTQLKVTSEFLQNEKENYEKTGQYKTNEDMNEGEKMLETIPDYTAFDFIKEEMENFDKTKLPLTETIDSSIRVETEIEQSEGSEPKEIITKKIIISEKLIELPEGSAPKYETSETMLKKLMDINEDMKTQMTQIEEQVERTKSGSQEKIEKIETEYAEKMKDLELAKGDVVEDVSILEKEVKKLTSALQEKVTDLDDENIKTVESPSKKNEITKLSEKENQHKEEIQVTEDLVKDLRIEYYPSDNLSYEEGNITRTVSDNTVGQEKPDKSVDVQKISETNIDLSDLHPKHDNLIVKKKILVSSISDDSPYITSTQVETESSSKRKPLFTMESEEEVRNIVKVTSERDLETLLENIKSDGDSGSQIVEKSDSEVIEEKLRDLGKALDDLEIELDSDDKKDKKLKRVERKFERMASEILEPAKQSPSDNKQFQQLVSQLSTDEVNSFQKEYSNLWDDYTYSKTDEWDSKTPDSQADLLELPQGETSTKMAGSHDVPTLRDQSSTELPEGSTSRKTDQHQLSDEMKELLEEMEKASHQ